MSVSERPTRFPLIRHGNHDSGGRFLQHACIGLSPVGVVQSRALASRLADDPTLTSPVVLASRARRAIDTAKILAGALGVSVAGCTCDLCEVHPGAAEGLTPEEMGLKYGPVSAWTRPYQAVPDADDFTEWLAQTCAALERIAATYRGRQILALTHGGVIRASFVAFGRRPEG